jgi:phosphoglycolate phosphatase
MVSPRADLLLLFDIDGTLVRGTGPYHRDALVAAVRNVLGIDSTTEGVPVHGMLDRAILRQMIANAGGSAEEAERVMPALVEEAERVYVESCPLLPGKTCPGVEELLDRLQQQKVPIALVTGNFSKIGWKKLEQTGLKQYFRWGAFAEMAETRGELAELAIAQVRASGHAVPKDRIALIGDAPSDIQAARENGIRSISVATGISSREELAVCEPDELIESLEKFVLF